MTTAFRYSPERRTALVLSGTGAHGAYHAGVLRALQEAGVKIDVVAGHGIGAAGAALAAIDGGSRLWEADGVWRSPSARAFYRVKWPLRAAPWILVATGTIGLALLVATALGLPFAARVVALIALAASLGLVAVAVRGGGALRAAGSGSHRRTAGGRWWSVVGGPLDTAGARQAFADALGALIRGANAEAQSAPAALGRRYTEVLTESLGQPGFRELMIVVTDLDARRDTVAALLREPYRHAFVAARQGVERRSEAVDLAGTGRDHALDFVSAALTPAVACDPHLVTFGTDSYWRGESHRFCDRPGACSRLLEELADAGVSQAIVVSAVAPSAAPHRLRAPRLDVRGRLGEFLAAAESAALRDAMAMARLRFDSIYLIAPGHNPVGAFDVEGAYDEASDRRQDLTELMARAYEDAYHQFIEPVVGASGERLVRSVPGE